MSCMPVAKQNEARCRASQICYMRFDVKFDVYHDDVVIQPVSLVSLLLFGG